MQTYVADLISMGFEQCYYVLRSRRSHFGSRNWAQSNRLPPQCAPRGVAAWEGVPEPRRHAAMEAQRAVAPRTTQGKYTTSGTALQRTHRVRMMVVPAPQTRPPLEARKRLRAATRRTTHQRSWQHCWAEGQCRFGRPTRVRRASLSST